MKKCFLCGKEYDEKNRKALIKIALESNEKLEPVKRITDSTGKVLQMCPSCVRAGTFIWIRNYQVKGSPYRISIDSVYEDDENVANQTTPVIADVKSDDI